MTAEKKIHFIFHFDIIGCLTINYGSFPCLLQLPNIFHQYLQKNTLHDSDKIGNDKWNILFHSEALAFKVSQNPFLKGKIYLPKHYCVAQLLKNPPAIWEICVRSLGWEDPLQKGKATHFSILVWRIPWTV